MADYYVTTTDGRTHLLENVTATPTIVVNDGVATTVFDGVYRDLLPYPNTGANQSTTYPFGPSWTGVPTYSGSPLAITAYDIVPDDVAEHVAPRFLELKKSYWKFVCDTFEYFFPIEQVTGMSNTKPTY